jgi:hypothetical protein
VTKVSNIFYHDTQYCSYPEDRIPPHTSSKSRQRAGCASTRCHVNCTFGPHLPAEVGSGVTMCPATPDHASLLWWAPALPRVLRLQTLPPWRGELRCYHVSHGSGLCLPERGAPMLSRVPRPRRAVDHRNKERLNCPRHAARLACFQGTLVRYRGACKTCVHTATVWLYMQYRPSWPLIYMATKVIRPDMTAPRYEPCSVQQSDKTGWLHAADVI